MTQSVGETLTGLVRVRQAAKQNPTQRFDNLLKHITPELLRRAYFALNAKAAEGIDDVSWEVYGEELDTHIPDLCTRVHTNRYKPKPVKRIWIPKANGQQRPIGITAIEDKVVQQAVVWVLEAIYEVDFLGFTHFCSVRWSTGDFALRRITIAKRQRETIAAIKKWLMHNRHLPVFEIGQ